MKTSLYNLMLNLFPPFDAESTCMLVITVTRLSGDQYGYLRQGEADAKLTVAPALPAQDGPGCFSESVLSDSRLRATTKDGGVLYFNVARGDYNTLSDVHRPRLFG